MADELYYPGLTTTEALELLAHVGMRDGASTVLSRIRICVQVPILSAYDARLRVTLCLSARSGKRTRLDRDAEDAFTEDYRRLSGLDNPVASEPTGGLYRPLLEGLPSLLLNGEISSDTGSDPALKDSDMRMIVATGLQDEQAAGILEDLNHWAPPVSIAAREEQSGVRAYYYLVNNRPFQAVDSWATGQITGCSVPLHCYFVERHGMRRNVFLSPETEPARAALEHVVDLLLGARGMYDWGDPLPEPRAVLAIVLPKIDTNESGQVHYLGNLNFIDRFEIQPLVHELANFEVFAGDGSTTAQQRLQQTIHGLEPKVGYQLRLRPAFRHVVDEEAYQAARQRQDEAAYEMDLIDSLRQARPTLLRFTQRQLPALAEVIRSYRVVDTQRLLYAFQADSFRHPGGAHYLLVDPTIALDDLDPIVYWEGQSEQPMRFWIDPYWASDYYQGDYAVQVYVPYGAVLSPALHSWRTDDMDAHLHRILLRWHETSEDGAIPTPRTAMYVFDGHTDRQLDVFVLDRQAFQPLTARLEWLNACLDVQGMIHVEEAITQMSSSKAHQRLAHYFAQQEEQAVKAFAAAQWRAEQTMAEHSRELLDAVTEELAKLTARAQDLSLRSAELNARLLALEADYTEMVRLTSMTESLKTRVMAGADALSAYSTEIVHKVEGSIRRSCETRERLQKQLDRDVQALNDTHEILRLRLNELRRLL